MKTWMFILLAATMCGGLKPDKSLYPDKIKKEIVPAFAEILDEANVTGTVIIVDHDGSTAFSNDFEAGERQSLPASTFKIPNAIIGLETGVIDGDNTRFVWDGKSRALPQWEQDLSFKQAFHLSCLPCFQEIAKKVGAGQMADYLKKLNYGHMDVNEDNIDVFWLRGKSSISPYEQIDFLRRFYFSELPIKETTEKTIKQLMLIEENDQFKLSGKTGWAIRDGNNIGWFTGYLEAGNRVYFFCTNIWPHESFNMDMFAKIRSEITMEAFKQLGISQ